YLAGTPDTVQTRTLADLIAFNEAEPRELEHFGQELFESAQETNGLDDPEYIAARDNLKRLAGPEGIDRLLADNDIVAFVTPTTTPSWRINLGGGDEYGASATQLPATAGYPHLTVPMGLVDGLPVGLSFIGPKWSEQLLLSLGRAYEQASQARVPPTAYKEATTTNN
ncbi:MAG: amidase, partial [Rhodospirillaceae bacterium]